MSEIRQNTVAVRTSTVGFSSGFQWRGRASDWGQLLWAAPGAITVTVASALWIIPHRQALWLPSGTANDVRMVGRGVLRAVYLARRACRGLGTEPRALAIAPLLRELLRRAFEHDTLDRAVPREARLVSVLRDELRAHLARATIPVDLPMPRDQRAMRAAEAVLIAPGNTMSTATLARSAQAGARTLERLFSAETGLSLGAWRQRAALVHGMKQLSEGESVTRAALAAGYSSTSAFVSAFRRLTGVTPGRFASATDGGG